MSSQAHAAPASALSIFRNRSFTRLWLAQLISVAGSALTSLASAMLVYRLTGSALSVGLMLMVAALPSLLIGPIAGVYVDRLNRKHVMVVADLLRATLVAAIPLALPFGIAWLYAIVLVVGAIGQFFDPAHSSVLPELASDDELAAANSLMAISSTGAWALGFSAAGLIVSQLAIGWAFAIDALSFLISAACIAGVRIAPAAPADNATISSVLRDMREGAGFLARTPSLRSLLLIAIPMTLSVGMTNALLLPFALSALGASEFQYSLIEGLCSVGFIAGSLLMARLADRLHEAQWIVIGEIGMGLAYIAFALASSVPMAILVLMFAGLCNAPSAIGRQLVIQRGTPSELRGRVYSAFFVVRDVVGALGMAAAGLADLYDVRLLFVGGTLVALAAAATILIMPGLRQSAAEWRQAARLLRGARLAPGLGMGRAASAADLARLAGELRPLAGLGSVARRGLLATARIYDVPAGTTIMRQGEPGDAAYFVLSGRAVAGAEAQGVYRVFEPMLPGDFFGEIAALTGLPRTATVVAEEPATVLALPAEALRQITRVQQLSQIFLDRIAERIARSQNLAQAQQLAGEQQRARSANPYATARLQRIPDAYATERLQAARDLYATAFLQAVPEPYPTLMLQQVSLEEAAPRG